MFTFELICNLLFGFPPVSFETILGSFLLLNEPSIGYVWIMRVFLILAFLLPILDRFLKNRGLFFTGIIIVILIILQEFFTSQIYSVENRLIHLFLDEIILYAIGYSAIAILGLKIKSFKRNELLIIVIASLFTVIIQVCFNNWLFNPQSYKYPPHSLYILYGIFMSALLWYMRPIFPISVIYNRFLRYISENSMWIYLWHIIPIYLIKPWANISNMWFLRYCIVLISAIVLNIIYHKIITWFPDKIYAFLK